VKEHEYNNIDYFRDLQSYNPSQRLLKYRLNIILICGALLFYLLSDFKAKSINVVFVQGDFQNTYLIDLFLWGYLIYNFLMFYLLSKTEIEKYKLLYTFPSFAVEVAKYKVGQGLKRLIGDSPPVDEFRVAKGELSLSHVEDGGKNGFRIQMSQKYFSKLGIALNAEVLTPEGFLFDRHVVFYDYYPDEHDSIAFEKQKSFLRHATSLSKADLCTPYVFLFLTISVALFKKVSFLKLSLIGFFHFLATCYEQLIV